jgi:lysophospholipase L1-like esterase
MKESEAMGKFLKSFLILLIFSLMFSSVGYAKSENAKQHLLGLGDSIPYGYNLGKNNDHPSKLGFPSLMGEEANINVRNLAVPGLRSDQMLQLLKFDQKYRQAVRHADYITLTIGNNDLLQALAAAEIKSGGDQMLFQHFLLMEIEERRIFDNIKAITEEIGLLTDATMVLYNVYNPFHQEAEPGLHQLANQLLPTIVNPQFEILAGENIVLADAYSAFGSNQAKYVIVNDIHPTVEGQRKLAEIGLKSLGF